MKLAGWVYVVVTVLMAARAHAEEPTRRGGAFGPGEQSSYRISYLGLTAGKAQVTVGAEMKQWGKEVWPIVASAKSESMMNVYPIKDRFVTYWDDRVQRTLGSDLFADENRKRRRQRIRLEGETATVTQQREGEEEVEHTRDIPGETQDMAAVTFALRNKALRVGDHYEVPIFTGGKQFNLKASVEGLEQLTTCLGEREVIRVRVVTDFSGKLVAKRDMFAYFTNDARRIPVRIEAEFLLGRVVGELTAYEPGRDQAADG